MQIDFIPTRFASRRDVCDVLWDPTSALLCLFFLLWSFISNQHWKGTLGWNFQLLQFGAEHPVWKSGAHGAKASRSVYMAQVALPSFPKPLHKHPRSHWRGRQQKLAKPSCTLGLSITQAREPHTSTQTYRQRALHVGAASQQITNANKKRTGITHATNQQSSISGLANEVQGWGQAVKYAWVWKAVDRVDPPLRTERARTHTTHALHTHYYSALYKET